MSNPQEPQPPRVETVVLDCRELIPEGEKVGQLIWHVGTEIIGPDNAIQTILNKYGEQGFRVMASGGILADGFGPSRLILSRVRVPDPSQEKAPGKRKFFGEG